MKTVIIVGKGLTARELPEWIERYPYAKVWRLNDDLRYSDRCDRMYQLHDNSDIPVDSEWQRIVHPSKGSLGNREGFGFKPLSSPRRDHIANTICYMLYDAELENYNHIVMVGCDFLVDRLERDEELPHVMWWMGYLEGRGVTFDGPKASAIFENASYMNDDEDIQTAINNTGDIGVPFVPDITESEYRSMLTLIDTLMNRDPDPTTPEGMQLAALVRIVEQYEAKHYPIGPIEHLFSANALQKTASGYEPAGPCEVYSVALGDSYPLWQLLHEEHGLILLNGEIEDIINVATPIIEQRKKAESKERYLRAKAAMEGDEYIDGVCYFINN